MSYEKINSSKQKIEKYIDSLKICDNSKNNDINNVNMTIVEKFTDIDVSAENYFKKFDDLNEPEINESYINNLYNSALTEVETVEGLFEIKKHPGWLTKFNELDSDNANKKLGTKEKNFKKELGKQTKLLKKELGILKKELLAQLKKENKRIYEYLQYRALYSELMLVEIPICTNQESSKDTKTNLIFKEKFGENSDSLYFKWSTKTKIKVLLNNGEKLQDFKELRQKLLEDAQDLLNKQNIENSQKIKKYLSSQSILQKIFAHLGIFRDYSNVRHDKNTSYRKFTDIDFSTSSMGLVESQKTIKKKENEKKTNSQKLPHYMKNLSDAVKLSQIKQVGSHDAMTYGIDIRNKSDLVGIMAKTQSGTILSQSRNRVTVFDIRLELVGNVVCCFHGIANGGPVSLVFKQLRKFFERYDGAVITLHIFADEETINAMMENSEVKKFFEDYVYNRQQNGSKNYRDLTLGEVRNKVLIVTSRSVPAKLKDYAFKDQLLQSFNKKFRQANDNDTVIAGEVGYLGVQNELAKKYGGVTTASPFHTPGIKSVFSYLGSDEKSSHNIPAEDSAQNAASYMTKYLQSVKDYNLEAPNILFSDNTSDKSVSEANAKFLKEYNQKNITKELEQKLKENQKNNL